MKKLSYTFIMAICYLSSFYAYAEDYATELLPKASVNLGVDIIKTIITLISYPIKTTIGIFLK